jgi:hypothetical protein
MLAPPLTPHFPRAGARFSREKSQQQKQKNKSPNLSSKRTRQTNNGILGQWDST